MRLTSDQSMFSSGRTCVKSQEFAGKKKEKIVWRLRARNDRSREKENKSSRGWTWLRVTRDCYILAYIRGCAMNKTNIAAKKKFTICRWYNSIQTTTRVPDYKDVLIFGLWKRILSFRSILWTKTKRLIIHKKKYDIRPNPMNYFRLMYVCSTYPWRERFSVVFCTDVTDMLLWLLLLFPVTVTIKQKKIWL